MPPRDLGLLSRLSAAMTRRAPACTYWARGSCRAGAQCRFAHDGAPVGAPPAPPVHLRRFTEAPPAPAPPPGAPPPRRLRVMSYNVLAEAYAREHAGDLYTSVPRAALAWPARLRLLAAEVAHFAPDVVCLQEVDRWDDLAAALGAAGYAGAHAARTGDRPDGCATFWRRGALAPVSARAIEFAPLGLKDNVAQLVVLRWAEGGGEGEGEAASARGTAPPAAPAPAPRRPQHVRFDSDGEAEDAASPAHAETAAAAAGFAPPGAHVLVANIHVLFNPKRGDVKLAQVRTLLEAAAAEAAAAAAPAVVCGDFNSAAGSALYEFITRGALDLASTDRRCVSGQVEAAGRTGWPALQCAFLAELVRAERAGEGAGAPAEVREAAALEAAMANMPRPASSGADLAGTAAALGPVRDAAPAARGSAAKPPRPWALDELRTAIGECEAARDAGAAAAAVARHPLALRSAYAAAAGREPLFTTLHDRYVGTVDYLFYTPEAAGGGAGRLRPVRVLQPPPLRTLRGGLPSPAWGSDHVSLVADFELAEATG
jgi:mRNA deadenylase 3'-5' endonuclease subunit Ccr4